MKIDFIEKFLGLFHFRLSVPDFHSLSRSVQLCVFLFLSLPISRSAGMSESVFSVWCVLFCWLLSSLLSMCSDAEHNKWSDFVPHRDLNFVAHKILYGKWLHGRYEQSAIPAAVDLFHLYTMHIRDSLKRLEKMADLLLQSKIEYYSTSLVCILTWFRSSIVSLYWF